MKTKKLPTTKARNALQLLRAVRRLIEAEPKRMNMEEWVIKRVPGVSDEKYFPACGMIGCIGGWMYLLKPVRSTPQSSAFTLMGADIEQIWVGNVWANEVYDLFMGSETYPFPYFTPGTKAYAKAVLRNIDRFINKHKDTLKSITYEEDNATRSDDPIAD